MSEGIGTAPSPAPQPGPGEANPPPPSEGTQPGGEIDTAVPGGEPPPPWTPPAHWPPLPAGVSPDALAHWIASNRQTDAIKDQTDQLKAAQAAAFANAEAVTAAVEAQFILAMFASCGGTPMTEAQVRSRALKLLPEFRKALAGG